MKPHYDDGEAKVLLGDCLELLAEIPEASIDAIVTDPPYGLAELSTARVVQALAAWMGGDRDHVPDGKGFMGRDWDSFVPPPGVWDQCLRVLKPGGHLLAFAAPRTQDLMGLSIRIAGFEIRDGINWIYGSGMPKGLDISKAIDKAASAEREIIGYYQSPDGTTGWEGQTSQYVYSASSRVNGQPRPLTAPTTDGARRWAGWNTQLKPAHEPIIVARKSTGFNTTVANVLEWGTGAINIGACRVDTGGQSRPAPVRSHGEKVTGGVFARDVWSQEHMHGSRAGVPTSAGRWPANVALSHSPDCIQIGERMIKGDARAGQEPGTRQGGFLDIGAPNGDTRPNGSLYDDQVVADFDCAPDCPVAELDAQSGVLTSGAAPSRRGSDKIRTAYGAFEGQRECVPARGANSGGASRFFPAFRYQAKAPASERPRLDDGTQHVSVKPLDLMRWLVRLVTPPGGVILDPFAGSGTTLEAAILEGFRAIGIEREPAYADLCVTRLAKPLQPSLFGDVN